VKVNQLIMNRQALLAPKELKAFMLPDTGSNSPGMVSKGRYQVKEIKENHPNKGTDYVKISVPDFPNQDIWVCTRWKGQYYAKILIEFDNDPWAVQENALTGLLGLFHDFKYDLNHPRYPFSLPGISTPLAPPAQNNCCTFVEALLVKAWSNSFPNFQWDMKRHNQLMITSTDDYFSPVTALVDSNIALPVTDQDQPPHPWTVIQGWRNGWTAGHTFMIIDHHLETDRILTLESNAHYKLDGVGFRQIGNLRDVPKPHNNWWENNDLWTWQDFLSFYEFRKQGILRIKDRKWAKETI